MEDKSKQGGIVKKITGCSIKQIIAMAPVLLANSDTPHIDIEVLLKYVLKKGRAYLYTYPEKVPTPKELQAIAVCLERRMAGVPIAYITQEREFWSVSLRVNESVLIPRGETELLVELAIDELEKAASHPNLKPLQVIDVGTGSGAIALALADSCPNVQVSAVDISTDALMVAQINATRLNLEKVKFCHSDLLSAFPERPLYYLIVSNPPYIDRHDSHLRIGDVRFEPERALVAHDQGFQVIDRLVDESKSRLLSGGVLMVEHGFQQGDRVRQLFHQAGFKEIQTHLDLAGLERVTCGRM